MTNSGLIIIATYNEMENLPRLVENLRSNHPELDILVIDDRSPDGTGTWVRQSIQDCDSNSRFIYLIERAGKLGLGSATIEGFNWALQRDYELVITMDADFSHHPDELYRLLEPFSPRPTEGENQSPDLVIGSRYVDGGGIEGWPLYRKWTSRITNGFARTWLRLRSRDNTGAFRVYSAKILKRIPLSRLDSGYAYLSELVWRIQNESGRILEVPITFRDREQGKSKTSLSVGLKVFWRLFTLPWAR